MTTHRFRQADLDEVETLAWLLDNSIPVPGTGRRLGIDAIIGLVPGIGDLLSGMLGLLIVGRAAALGLPRVVVARMLFNVAIDFVVGALPVAGDAFDLWFKANARNIALMRDYLGDRDRSTAPQWAFFAAALAGLLVIAALAIWLVAELIGSLARLI